MILSTKVTTITAGETNDDGDELLATVTAKLECGAIILGIEVVKVDGKLKVARNSRPLFTTKELRKAFCAKVIADYEAVA